MIPGKKGKILKIKTGYNPNSSSIGTNLMPLLLGGTILSMLTPIIAIFISRRLNKKRNENLETPEQALLKGTGAG